MVAKLTTDNAKGHLELWIILAISVISLFALSVDVTGQPQGATLVSIFNESTPTATAGSRDDAGGGIYVVNIDSTQQNAGWKAYVGNVTGRLTLDDGSGNTIYDWTIPTSDIDGEVYVSRNSSVTWTNVTCANLANISAEQTFLSMPVDASDNINRTFNYTSHSAMQVGTSSIAINTCRSTATYINDSRQNGSVNASIFQEILLQDLNDNLVYATFIDQDQNSYKITTNATYDFQLLVGEDDTSGTPTTYYFYLEIS